MAQSWYHLEVSCPATRNVGTSEEKNIIINYGLLYSRKKFIRATTSSSLNCCVSDKSIDIFAWIKSDNRSRACVLLGVFPILLAETEDLQSRTSSSPMRDIMVFACAISLSRLLSG